MRSGMEPSEQGKILGTAGLAAFFSILVSLLSNPSSSPGADQQERGMIWWFLLFVSLSVAFIGFVYSNWKLKKEKHQERKQRLQDQLDAEERQRMKRETERQEDSAQRARERQEERERPAKEAAAKEEEKKRQLAWTKYQTLEALGGEEELRAKSQDPSISEEARQSAQIALKALLKAKDDSGVAIPSTSKVQDFAEVLEMERRNDFENPLSREAMETITPRGSKL
jgi:flagellar biosynthesis GTPase FlhF